MSFRGKVVSLRRVLRNMTYLLNGFTITTVSKRATTIIGAAPIQGAGFPYIVVVCGEP